MTFLPPAMTLDVRRKPRACIDILKSKTEDLMQPYDPNYPAVA